MRLKEHRRIVEEAVNAEREECARIAEYVSEKEADYEATGSCQSIADKIRARGAPIAGYIRPETAEKNPELLKRGYRIAGQGLSADGQRIIGNGRGSEHPVLARIRGSETLIP